MCIIIVNQSGAPVSTDRLETAVQDNPHGIGVAWLDTYRVERAITVDRLIGCARPFIAHFRYATVGATDSRANIHPHKIARGKWLFHNGTVKGVGDDTVSDSVVMASILRDVSPRVWSDVLRIAAPSRFVTLDTRARSFTLHGPRETDNGQMSSDAWTLDDGVWYSKCPDINLDYWHYYDRQSVTRSAFGRVSTGFVMPADSLYHAPDNSVPVFVYGTLKSGHGNNRLLASADCIDDTATTLAGYTLEDGYIPYMHAVAGSSDYVTGEVYRVDGETLERLDALEGHPDHYCRRRIPVNVDGKVTTAWCYFATHTLPRDAATVSTYTGGPDRAGDARTRYIPVNDDVPLLPLYDDVVTDEYASLTWCETCAYALDDSDRADGYCPTCYDPIDRETVT